MTGEIDTLTNENNVLQVNQVKLEDFIKNKELETDYQEQKLNVCCSLDILHMFLFLAYIIVNNVDCFYLNI